MSVWVELADWAERNPWAREARHALRDGAYHAWLPATVAAVMVWIARGMPSPVTAAAAAGVAVVGAAAGGWRAARLATGADVERSTAAAQGVRRWLTLYAVLASVIPAVLVGALAPVLLAVVALVWLAVVTIPMRGRRRLLARLRIGAATVAGTDDVRVGRVLWGRDGRTLRQIHVVYPPEWAAHKSTRRDELVERMMWELCGPPPASPAQARVRPDYATAWDHVHTRLEVVRVAPLPRLLPARPWPRPAGAIVLGQTTPELADLLDDEGRPLALYRPNAHALIVGATQHGKSSGVRAWAADGLTHGVFPGGLWGVDGKGSGSLAPLADRQGVHTVAHEPDQWRAVIAGSVAPEVARRYAEMLAWRSGTASTKPTHPKALLILDEIQQVLLACPDLADTLNTLARQALEANVILWVLTQRPDAKDAVPGALRDQLVNRVTFGPLSSAGAKMAFDIGDDWHKALGVAPIAGRALTWLEGSWRPLQAPWLPFPADHPDAEPLYPPRASRRPVGPSGPPGDDPAGPPPSAPLAASPAVSNPAGAARPPAPRKDVDAPAEPPVESSGEPSARAAYDPSDPYASRRRRRRTP
ncbi:hypothetical protein ACFXJ8_39240 [Nonomuraea sp. NPDC059194]|uniref:hypothetical protein n=1 Tax=Nonomuraea sp. NPDC059194 TaxID=3346764 RepID=UPI0036B55999